MNAPLNAGTSDIRELSLAELDAVSGGEMKSVTIGPITIAAGDGQFYFGIKGVLGVGVSDDGVCGTIGPLMGCV